MIKPNTAASGDDLHALFHEVFLLHAALAAVVDEVHARAGLRTSQVKVADVLERAGPIAVPDIAARLGVSRQFVQTLCNEFETAGLVRFLDSPRHKRSKLVALTDKGKRALARAWGAESAIIENTFRSADSKTVKNATALLQALRETLAQDNGGTHSQ